MKPSNLMKPSIDKAADALGIPRDLPSGTATVTMVGTWEVYIENHRGILELEKEYIRIQTRGGKLRIEGKRLQIDHYTAEDMKISGRISGVVYEQKTGQEI